MADRIAEAMEISTPRSATSALTASSAEALGDAATARAVRMFSLPLRSGSGPCARISSERWFPDWAGCVLRCESLLRFIGVGFELPLSFAGFLPIFFRELL